MIDIRRCDCGRELDTLADVICDDCHDAERDRELETQARLRAEDRDAEIQAELHSFWYGWPSGGGIIS